MTGSRTLGDSPSEMLRREQSFWRDQAASWTKWDFLLIAVLVLGGVGWILLHLRAIEYGDPVTHWAWLNSALAGDPLDVRNHHDARFGLSGPALVVRLLFGDHPNIYYMVPLTAFAVLAATTYMLGSRIFDRRVGVLAAGVLVLFPQSLRSGSQLLPDGFEATFALLSAYFVLTRTKADRGEQRLVLGAVLLFVGYLAKESALLYAPGLVIAIWLIAKSWRAIFSFSTALLALLGLEALVYLIAPWQVATRLSASTAVEGFLPVLESPFDLFDRYLLLPGYWLWAFIIATAGAVVTWRFLDTRIRAFLVIPASFLLVMTFGLWSLDPLRPLVHFQARFLTSVIPFLLLFLAYLILGTGDLAGRVLHDRSRALAIVAALAISLVALVWFLDEMDALTAGSRNTEGIHPLALNSMTEAAISSAIAEQRTILLGFDLEEGSADVVRGNAKRLRYMTVFYFPIDSPYRAACLVEGRRQLIVIAPSETFGDGATALSQVSESGEVVLLNSGPADPWWRYRVSELPAGQVNGLQLLGSAGPDTHTITIREAAFQTVVASLCPET